METGRTFATIFADMDFRQRLLDVHGETEFKNTLLKHAQDLASEQSNPTRRLGNHEPDADFEVSLFQSFKLEFVKSWNFRLRKKINRNVEKAVKSLDFSKMFKVVGKKLSI